MHIGPFFWERITTKDTAPVPVQGHIYNTM